MTNLQVNLGLTLPQVLLDRAQESAEEVAFWQVRGGNTHELSWQQIYLDVSQLASSLHNAGITKGDKIVILATNSYRWILADFAIASLGAVSVPLHTSYGKTQIEWMVKHCEAKIAFAEDHHQSLKLLNCDFLKRIIQFESLNEQDSNSKIISFDRLVSEEMSSLPEIKVAANDLASIIYTSGTTDHPKGVMLSHENLIGNALTVMRSYDQSERVRRLVILPLSHVYARTCDLYVWLLQSGLMMLAQSRETIFADCQRFKPTMINAVPYFYQKLVTSLEANKRSASESLNSMLGGQIRMCACGGAALPRHVEEYFQQQQIPLYQGYGLTETSPVISTSKKEHQKIGSVGKAISQVELLIADDGEILTKSPFVMQGYYKDEVATEQVIQNGWLHTGDLGEIDDEGFLFIKGRKREIAVTATGKNICLNQLEILLTAEPLIAQALVIAEERNYLTALIVPDPDQLKAKIRQHWLWVFSKQGALKHRRVLKWFQQSIDHALQDRATYEQIKKFHLMDRGFTFESGELTPKLSLKRQIIHENLKAEIEAMYHKKVED